MSTAYNGTPRGTLNCFESSCPRCANRGVCGQDGSTVRTVFTRTGSGDRVCAPDDTSGLLVGYFEGLNSERAIAWRVADSMSLRAFLDPDPEETPPNHSTLSRTRRRIDVETHGDVFRRVLTQLAQTGLVRGKTIGIDATTLEANAAMRSLVRRDTGEDYETSALGALLGVNPARFEVLGFPDTSINHLNVRLQKER